MRNIVHGGDIYSKEHIKNVIDFSANINPLGMPKSVKEAIINNIESYENYPDPLCRKLRQAISAKEGIDKDYIVCGNGAADVIFRTILALKPKKSLILAPTFAEYEEALGIVNCDVNYYDLKETEGFKIQDDILESINESLDIIFICNPNNPTGIALNRESMIKIAKECKRNNVILVIDECFSDFLVNEEEYSLVPYLNNYNNVIILKAFTKMYAMAGIRLGYMLCSNKNIVSSVSSIGQPWSVSTVAGECGIAACIEDEFVNRTKSYIYKNRTYLINELESLGLKVYPSKVNYILFKCSNISIKDKLENYGILIRSCNNYRNLDETYFRIAVKDEEKNIKLIDALKEILGAEI